MSTDTDIVERLRTVRVPESRHVGFAYETWAQDAAAEILSLRSQLEGMKGVLRSFVVDETADDDCPACGGTGEIEGRSAVLVDGDYLGCPVCLERSHSDRARSELAKLEKQDK